MVNIFQSAGQFARYVIVIESTVVIVIIARSSVEIIVAVVSSF